MYKGITRRDFLKGVAASAATMAAFGVFSGVSYAEETETAITYPDTYTREALAEGLKMTEEEIDLTVDAIVNTLLADGNTECFYTMIAGNADKTAIQGNPGYATGCPELGVPESYYHDGPAGVTAIYETTGFPVNMSLGSTFSKDLAYAYGEQEGLDNRIIGANFQLGTQMDVVRTGHWNRTKDTMGEDPFLTGTLGTQQVAGVQDQGVAAMIKHYAGYGTNGDTSVNVTIDEQTFHEFYVTSFEFPIRYANAASVMTTYNSIAVPGFTEENGEFTDSNDYINLDVLRDMVGFKGMICCDWGGQKEMSAFQGNTMAMPSAGNNTQENIEAAIEAGEGTFDQIVENVKANLYAYGIAGYLYYAFSNIYYVDGEARVKRDTSRDCADATTAITLVNTYDEDYTVEFMDNANKTVKEIAESGAVLLQNNNGALPLDTDTDSVALIGLGASYAITGTGAERSYGVVNYIDSPAEAIEKIAGADAKITTYSGIDEVGTTIPTEYIYTTEDGDEHGFLRTYGVVEESSGGFGFPGATNEEETEEETEESNELPEYVPGPDGTGVFASSDIWAMNGLSNESIYVQEVSDTKTAYFMVKDSETGEVYELDEVAGIDETIDFTAGIHADGRRDFNNADEEDAIEAGNAITNGEAYTWTGYLEAPEDGDYSFILQSIGGTVTCTVDGQTVSSGASSRQGTQWGWDNLVSSREGMGIGTPVTMTLEAGKRYKIEITGIDMPTDLADIKDMQIRLSWIPAGKAETDYDEALQAARDNNKVVFFMYDNTTGNSDSGSTMAWGETSDEEVTPASRTIAAEQLKLLNDIIDAANEYGNQVIVVLNTASSIAFCDDTYFTDGNGWADKVDSILEMWFGGQAVGTATAELLLGVVSPSGKLPITFQKYGTDTSISYSQEAFNIATGENIDTISNGVADNLKNATVAEGIFIGYRWYDEYDVTPAFDFGHGLSYTTFAYSDLSIEKTADVDYGYDVTFTVTNTGDVAGAEVAQVYIGKAEVPDGIMSAQIQLCGFDRTDVLEPGESQSLTIQISKRSLSYWNTLQEEYNENEDGTIDKWTVAHGDRIIYVGTASDNLELSETVTIA